MDKEENLEKPPIDAPYMNATLPIEERIDDLLSRMTLKEKIGQMALVEKNSVKKIEDISTYGLGAMLSGFGGKPENNTVLGWDTMVTDFITESKTSRLGIPIFYGADAIHGHTNVPSATVFPHFIGLGATNDEVLVEKIARATAEELAATSINWSFSPTLDLPRDIRWGRTYEAFSDDPKLVAKLGAAYLKGLQQNSDKEQKRIFVLGTPKHYIGLGAMVWGSSSNKEFKIDQGNTIVDEKALRQEYLIPFKAVVDAGAKSIMVGLNQWGDEKLSASHYLVTAVLKNELGFEGFAVSDWYGVYEIKGGDYKAAVTAVNAGIDMVMLPFDYQSFVKNINKAVLGGEISEDRIDDAVRRILRAKFSAGLFDKDESKILYEVVGSTSNRLLAREAVSKSLVLLKNTKATLPIKSSVKHIRVVGSAADNVGRQSGAWTVEWQGVDGNWLPESTSILAGIKERALDTTSIEYEEKGNFLASDKIADLGIAIVGEQPYAEGWGDKAYPVLGNDDLEAIKKLQAVSQKVVVIIVSGRPLLVTNEIASWDAVVSAWLPGSEGGGVSDVLFGDKLFKGTLPLPWPHHSEQLPITKDGMAADGTKTLFSRYFGLKY